MKYLAIIGLLSLSLFSQEIDNSFSNDTVSLDTVSRKTVSTASKTKSYAHKKITLWQKTFGGSDYDEANAITPTKDGGFIVAGYTGSFGSDVDIYLIKIDKNGNKIWQKTVGGSGYDVPNAITPTKDGGFIVAGGTHSFGNGAIDVYLIKIDKNGNKIWQKTFGGSKDDEADAITPTKDGGFIVAGKTLSFGNGNRDVYLIKIDKNGNKIWQKTFGGSGDDRAEAITPTKDGGFVVAGKTESFGNGEDVYLIKIDKDGKSSSGKNLKIAPKEEDSSSSSYSSSSSASKSVSFDNCHDWSHNGTVTCSVRVDGDDKGTLSYYFKNRGNFYVISVYAHGESIYNLYNKRVEQSDCGSIYADSLPDAINKVLECAYNRHF